MSVEKTTKMRCSAKNQILVGMKKMCVEEEVNDVAKVGNIGKQELMNENGHGDGGGSESKNVLSGFTAHS